MELSKKENSIGLFIIKIRLKIVDKVKNCYIINTNKNSSKRGLI